MAVWDRLIVDWDRGKVVRKSQSIRMLLAGASVPALAASITTAAAAAPLLLWPGGGGGTVNVTTPTDFVVIDSYLLTGDFNNSSTIGNFSHGAGITIGNHSLITGTLNNEAVTGIIQ